MENTWCQLLSSLPYSHAPNHYLSGPQFVHFIDTIVVCVPWCHSKVNWTPDGRSWVEKDIDSQFGSMMTSSNGNIFRVAGHLCGNSPVTGDFPSQTPVTWSVDVFFEPRLNKQLSKQSWRWYFETPSRSLWHYCNAVEKMLMGVMTYYCDSVTATTPQPRTTRTKVHVQECIHQLNNDHVMLLNIKNKIQILVNNLICDRGTPGGSVITLNSLRPSDAYMRQ